jgi:CHASE2 domain-containing sensor protein
MGNVAHGLVAVWVGLAALVTASDNQFSQLLERQLQTFFFELRGPVQPPPQVVIVAIDEATVQAAQHYFREPKRLSFLEPISTMPPKRSAYAVAIDRLLQAGARSVSLDVIVNAASQPQIDQQLVKTLKKYPGQVVLAASYEQPDRVSSGAIAENTGLLGPLSDFADLALVGNVSHLVEPNGRIHRLGGAYFQQVAQDQAQQADSPEQAKGLAELREFAGITATAQMTFAQAALKAAGQSYPAPRGEHIYFYGPAQTFPHVSLTSLLDPEDWAQVKSKFKDAIVLIGSTATIEQDFQSAPFSRTLRYPIPLSGVEINANEVATLLQGKSLVTALPDPRWQGGAVFVLVGSAVLAQMMMKRSLFRLLLATALSGAVFVTGYGLFVSGWIVPVALPSGAIALSGLTYFVLGGVSELINRRNLRRALEPYTNVPLIRAIISQQEDLKDLLRDREQQVVGKLVGGRYCIQELLGAGGFGETYIVQDLQRPQQTQCVVKQLRPTSNDLRVLQYSRELFEREAQTLDRLGSHAQIPQLLAYFEEDNEFYLAQEYIPGHALSRELAVGKRLPETQVIDILQQILTILQYVHGQGVIHRDIKPSNILRRQGSAQLVLIDFGAVKAMQNAPTAPDGLGESLAETELAHSVTVGVGTQGYMPSEQCAGSPRFNSDIYALGKLGIQALVGLPPSQFKEDPRTGEILWQHQAQVSQPLAMVLSKMVRYDFRRRYQSTSEVLAALQELTTSQVMTGEPVVIDFSGDLDEAETVAAMTQPWPDSFTAPPSPEPATEVPTQAMPPQGP